MVLGQTLVSVRKGGPVLLGWLVREELVLGAVAEGRESCYCKGGNDGHSNVSEGKEDSG